MNVVQLYKYIGDIATALPTVHSYYNQSVYECWDSQEIKYGSLVFAVKNARVSNQTIVYDCVIYYGDRLNEKRTNCSSVQTDAISAIQSIVGAIKLSDDIVDVTYPVQCVLFEQKFSDDLAGAYANITITVSSIGECGYGKIK